MTILKIGFGMILILWLKNLSESFLAIMIRRKNFGSKRKKKKRMHEFIKAMILGERKKRIRQKVEMMTMTKILE